MTLSEILEQAKKLTQQERNELVEELRAMQDTTQSQSVNEPVGHWGKNLLCLLDEIGSIDLVYPEIEDPVERVKQIRFDEREQRLGDWGQ